MTEINRMDDPVCPVSLEQATLADIEVLECPYPTYKLLREQAPIYQDPVTGMFVVTRYEDLRRIALDYENFSNFRPSNDHAKLTGIARKAYERFKEKGWVPGNSLAARDDPEHKQMRSIFDQAFRPKRINAMDAQVEKLAYELIDSFIDDGECELVSQYAVPLPLIIICRQMGANMDDVWQIKAWTDAWIRGISFGISEEDKLKYTDMEIQAQHYFQAIFEQLRRQPNDTLLSDLVNLEVPGWGRQLTDNELHAEMMQDTFVDEVVRLESPAQGMSRTANHDVEINGVMIPKGAQMDLRYAAGNRDPELFENPDDIDLERRNAGAHLGFSTGTHYCLGAPLARRELYWAFKAFTDRIGDFRLTPGKNDLRHLPNYSLRILKELHIEFTPKAIR